MLDRDLLSKFWNSSSDACPLEADLADQQIIEFQTFVDKINLKMKDNVQP